MQKLTISNATDKKSLISYLNKRIEEYCQDLYSEGLTQQQYNILRGQIKELQGLVSELNQE